jgi:hypothetical protein
MVTLGIFDNYLLVGDNYPWVSQISTHLASRGADCPLFQTSYLGLDCGQVEK